MGSFSSPNFTGTKGPFFFQGRFSAKTKIKKQNRVPRLVYRVNLGMFQYIQSYEKEQPLLALQFMMQLNIKL